MANEPDGAKGNEQTSVKSDSRIVYLRGRKGYATEKNIFSFSVEKNES